ncbi:MAG: RluA family pseudouridine synthase [Pseudomonadota bacterium]
MHPKTNRHHLQGLEILHEDRAIIIVNKPAGLLTIGTEKEKQRTAYFILTDYLRKGNVRSRDHVFIVHRLDQDTSGILIFAKTAEARAALQDNWEETRKKYLTIVHGKMPKPQETISTYLVENSAHVVYSTPDTAKGKLAHTVYRVLKETGEYSLLEIDLLTGRKHQIRVHLAGRGHPVVGDRKYGGKDARHRQLALHALSISFRHPVNGRTFNFHARVPRFFETLVGAIPTHRLIGDLPL